MSIEPLPEGTFEPDAADAPQEPEEGIGLALSGGGYRAMLFHLGVLWRLNHAGMLPEMKRISSVSGGSITAACLGHKWSKLGFGATGQASRFVDEVVEPLRALAGETIDADSILTGLFSTDTITERVADAYRRLLFGDATLQDLPDEPRFVINASNMQSGVLWRFSKPYMGDYRVGLVHKPTVKLAVAVGASSAFPPVLSPAVMDVSTMAFEDTKGSDLTGPGYRTRVVLSDGGVYDNLGLETIWKRYRTLLVSDAGAKMSAEAAPWEDWLRHSIRVNGVIDNQVRSLRKRMLIDAYQKKIRKGAFWGIRTDITEYEAPGALPCPYSRTQMLAEVPTRLHSMEDRLQEQLINWGYAVSDAALRAFVRPSLPAPVGFPYPAAGI
jgi:NTE family protein